LVCSAFLGCTSQEKTESKTPTVRVSHPVKRPVIDYEVFTGRTEPYKNVDVRAQVTGKLDHILFEDGQDVAEGQKLFVLDQRPFKAELERAEAEIKQADAKMRGAQSTLDFAIRAAKGVSPE